MTRVYDKILNVSGINCNIQFIGFEMTDCTGKRS